MSRVKQLLGGEAVPCVALVKLAATETRPRLHREYQAKRRGLPADQCGERSAFAIDGKPLCRAHAGSRAIEILRAAQ